MSRRLIDVDAGAHHRFFAVAGVLAGIIIAFCVVESICVRRGARGRVYVVIIVVCGWCLGAAFLFLGRALKTFAQSISVFHDVVGVLLFTPLRYMCGFLRSDGAMSERDWSIYLCMYVAGRRSCRGSRFGGLYRG